MSLTHLPTSNLGGAYSALAVMAFTGWAFAVLLTALLLSKGFHRLILRIPSVGQSQWTKVLEAKKAELAMAWKDSRPLQLFAGDSHIELGSWYELLGGEYAVRNCGLSTSTIKDVASLLPSLADRNPETLVLMCGINSLARQQTPAECIADYRELLHACQSLKPHRIVVLSVMPVRESVADRGSRRLNEAVANFNRLLSELCAGQPYVTFVDVNPAVSSGTGLAHDLTNDGLHLNRAGYERLAGIVRNALGGHLGAR